METPVKSSIKSGPKVRPFDLDKSVSRNSQLKQQQATLTKKLDELESYNDLLATKFRAQSQKIEKLVGDESSITSP
jgi:predicted RNase H-like nuclease (RuvC/YqgF family)